MIRRLVDQAFNSGKYYISAVGLSTDVKPTEGIITGSKFVEVDTGIGYLFDETAGEWHENQQLSAAVQAYFEDHPEAIDQAAIEAMFGDQLDGIEEDIGGLKSAINVLEDDVYPIDTKTLYYDDINWNNSYIDTNGSLVSNAAYKTSPYMEVSEGDSIVYDGLRSISTSYFIIGAYDASKTFITLNSVKGNGTPQNGTYTVPQGVRYVILCTYNYGGFNDFNSVTMPVKTNKLDNLSDSVEVFGAQLGAVEDEVFDYHYTETGFSHFVFDETGTLDYYNGTEKEYAYCKRTDYIPTDGMISIVATIKGLNRWSACIACYDENKNYLADVSIRPDVPEATGATIQFAEGTITITNAIKYIRISIFDNMNHDNDTISITKTRNIRADYTAEKEKVDEINDELQEIKDSIWKGKKWYAFGTSLTDNRYLDPNNDPTGKYPQILNQWMQADLVNCGQGGGSITNYNGLIIQKIDNTNFADADLVTLEGFPNDYSMPIGDLLDTTTDTLAGAIYTAVTKIYAKAPNATVVLITASQGQMNEQGTAGYPIDFAEGKQLKFNEMTIRMAHYLGCHVIDAGGKAQINNFHPEYLVDHIHHSWAGGWQYAATIWEEMKLIHPNTDNPYLTE